MKVPLTVHYKRKSVVKVKSFVVLLISFLLCLSGCDALDLPSSKAEPEKSSSVSAPKAEEITEIKYEIQNFSKEHWKDLTQDNFVWDGGGASCLKVEWIDKDNLLFYMYRMNSDLAGGGECRIFSYNIPSDKTEMTAEYSISEGNITMKSFQRDSTPYVLFTTHHAKLYKLNLSNHSASVSDANAISELSNDGFVLYEEWGQSDTYIYDFLKRTEFWEQRNCIQKFQRDPLERFISWSPDGQYILFRRYSNLDEVYTNSKSYAIYSNLGEKITDITAEPSIKWCQEPGFLTYTKLENGAESRVLFDLKTGDKCVLPMNMDSKDDILIQEPDFSIIQPWQEGSLSGIYLLDHQTENTFPIEIEDYQNLSAISAVYNREISTVFLVCWMSKDDSDHWMDCLSIKIK